MKNSENSTDAEFLSEFAARPWALSTAGELSAAGLYIGKGDLALEVVVATAARKPGRQTIVNTWKARKGRRAAPVLLVILKSKQALVCGASGMKPPVIEMDARQAERLCIEALNQPDRHAALRLLGQALPSLETKLPGLNNEGLLALHELEQGVPRRADWAEATSKARRALSKRDKNLLLSLGFSIEPLDNLTSVLRSNDRRTALAVVLHDREAAYTGSARFNSLSPVSYAFKKADDEDLPWIILTQGNRIRLYATSVNDGVGRRGRTESYVECQPFLLSEQHIPYLWLLFSAEALGPNGSLRQILEGSQRFAGDLAMRLRERIYDYVVPELARGIAQERGQEHDGTSGLALTYEMALTVLFRLLFIAYAEDRDLLPFRTNESYRRRSLKVKAQELAKAVADKTPIAEGTTHWHETAGLWQSVATGNIEWGVPAYNGGLFNEDASVSKAGAELAGITLSNSCFEAALRHLLVIDTPEGQPGPVDFRSLGVREFGTIYEGLLESELAVAESDLVLKKKSEGLVYLPARPRDNPVVSAGEVYLHNRSGARKSSGSYYTKPFAVDHLLASSLEPALKKHFARLDELDDTDASEAFFDFRVADIAMGSGHFLIGAIDRIEVGMANYLTSRYLLGVFYELDRLRRAAQNELGELGKHAAIDDSQLLRRLIARRCIYGVDLNPLAVQLGRLAVWIHTFVPGLPLSFLDHNLVRGNSLVGVGTINEIMRCVESLSDPIFPFDTHRLLGKAEKPLKRLANINDASLDDIAAARQAAQEIRDAIRPTRVLCDLIAARMINDNLIVTKADIEEWERFLDNPKLDEPSFYHDSKKTREGLQSLDVFHFPIAFPEVFLRERPGFDVMVGNPPWQEATVEEDAFWARHFPGLRALRQRDQEAEKARRRIERPDLVSQYENELQEMRMIRRALLGGAYPGMGTGDPDLYKAFCWRFWQLTSSEGGQIGVVLPRSALSAKGSAKFRKTVFDSAAQVDVTMLVNTRNWVFPGVAPKYSVALLCIGHGRVDEKSIRLRGPFDSQSAFEHGLARKPSKFSGAAIREFNDAASLPLLPNEDSVAVFAQLRKAPRLDLIAEGEWRARPDRELDATNQKHLMDMENSDCPLGFLPVYKGASFNLWQPDTGMYYGWADPKKVDPWLYRKRLRAGNNRRSAHSEFSLQHRQNQDTLPYFSPRLALRDVARSTDPRTVIACLLPPKVFVTNTSPYFLWPRGDELDQAFLLGVLASIPLDWYARRFVEIHVNFHILNPFPIPRPSRDSPLWQRVVGLAGRLASPDDRFASWAEAVDVDCGPLADDEKGEMIHELDAVVSHLYGLTESQVTHIYETFHIGWDYQTRLQGVLRHFKLWSNRL